jgi:WD40 repeat protein
MATPENTSPQNSSANSANRWLEALHEAIVADRDSELSSPSAFHTPQQAAAFRSCLQLVERVRRARADSDATPSIQALETLGAPLVGNSPRRIGRFEIIRDLGRGGHGIVFLARDPHLDRQVAIKVPRPEMLLTPETRQRFLREAHAAARLSHPHIVAVHEVGDGSPVCYIAADYCPGETLHGYLRSHATPIPPRAAAVVCAELASAVQYAHDHGVLHRDLKPGNVLLAPRRQSSGDEHVVDFPYEPRLTDFGLARLAEYDAEQTRTGALVGTPAYMSPEQAEGRVHDIGPATDVYGLGAVLYEMLTCRPPFRGMTDVDTLRKVLHEDPTRPRVLRREVPRELEAICLRALEKNPRRRYSSAQAMAVDLHNFVRGLPVDAKTPTAVQRLAKWSRRNPALAAVWVLGALLICVLIWTNFRVTRALQDTERQAEISRRQAYVADIRLAGEAWQNAQPLEARELLVKHLPQPGKEDLRGLEWRYLWNSLKGSSQVISQQPTKIWSLAVAPGDRICATGDTEGVIRVWQINPPLLLHELRGHSRDYIDGLAFGYDNKSLFSGANDGDIRHWDYTTGQLVRVMRGHAGWIGALAISRSGEYLASGASDGRILIWNTTDGKQIAECKKHDDAVRWLQFHRNSKWLASAAVDQPVHLEYFLDLTKGTNAEKETLEPISAKCKVFSLGTEGVNVWGAGSKLVRWDISKEGQGRIADHWPVENSTMKCMLNTQGLLIEGYESPPVICVRDTENNQREIHTFRGHSDAVRCLAASERGTFLSGSEDGTVRKWWLDGGNQARQRFLLPGEPYRLQWTPDGQHLMTIIADGSQWVRSGNSEPVLSSFLAGKQLGAGTICARDGRVVSIDEAGAVRWTEVGQPASEPRFSVPALADWPALDAENHRFACADDMTLLVMDAETGTRQWQFEHPAAIMQIAFLPDNRVITACQDGSLRSFNASTGKLLLSNPVHRQSLTFWQVLPDRQQLLTSSDDRTICLLDLKTLEVTRRYSYPRENLKAFAVADKRRILVCDPEGLSVIDSESGQIQLSISEPMFSYKAQLSPDGRAIALGASDSILLFHCD